MTEDIIVDPSQKNLNDGELPNHIKHAMLECVAQNIAMVIYESAPTEYPDYISQVKKMCQIYNISPETAKTFANRQWRQFETFT